MLEKSNTSALFARVSGMAERVIVPINDRALDRNDSAPAFYCVHDITGGALGDFLPLSRHLNRSVRFFGLQAPASRMADPAFTERIEGMARVYCDALQRRQPEGPLFLGGFSAGTIIALEMAQQLSAGGRDVALLAAIDAVPENTTGALPSWHPSHLLGVVRNLPVWFRHGGLNPEADAHKLPARLVNKVTILLKAAMGLHAGQRLDGQYSISGIMSLDRYPVVQQEFIHRLYNACFGYRAQPYPRPVVLYEAAVLPLMPHPQLARRWQSLAPQVEVVKIMGHHNSVLLEPQVAEIARDLERRILTYVQAG